MNKANQYLLPILLTAVLAGCGTSTDDVYTVKSQTLEAIVSANGELESAQQAVLAPPSISRMWQYKVKSLAPENTNVKKGDVVVTFDDKPVRDRLIDKTAEYDRAVKELENEQAQQAKDQEELKLALAEAKMNYEVTKRKAEITDDSMSDNDRQKAQIDYQIAKNEFELAKKKLAYQKDTQELNMVLSKGKVTRLKSEVDALKADIKRLKVKATMDGLVIYATDFRGEKPAVGESVQFGQPVIELAVIEDMQVKAQVDEVDFGLIRVGQSVKVTVDGPEPIITSGKIISIGNAFREKSPQDKRQIIDTIIELEAMESKHIRPGLTARIEIITGQEENVLLVPVSSLSSGPSGPYVTTKSGDKQAISIGKINNGFAVVTSGLTEGDTIL